MSTTAGAFIAGGIAACGAVTATHPFETVKIRMQLQGELQEKGHQPHHYRGPVHGVSVIVRNEGLRGIYRGLGCAYVYQLLLNGCRLGFYEPMRNGLAELLYKDGNVQHPGINMLCGASSGVIGAAAGSPFFLVKTRLQSFSPSRPVGTQHRGFVVCIFMHPPDTIMSRLYNQNGNLYKGVLDCLAKTIRTEGVLAIYKGFLPHLARILPHTILTLSLAEQTNKLMRNLEGRILPVSGMKSI
ncbi:hypothetical protein P8C59_003879 [Phyllachora maydis]|uniref:Mitochondrial oxaloacetate transport protein n=1 Tax=Phyllachora maydis TaxID=1825666 RepID=A0AAD9MAS7_9PEZI|nr:hypothetical protein P8C59_003879 [Phyllachora maydis]